MSTALVVVLGATAVVAVVVVLVASWRVPATDEALVVTGRRARIVRGGGSFVWIGASRVGRVDLSHHALQVDVEATAAEGIGFVVTLDGAWRVGGDDRQILDAARNFVHHPDMAGRRVEAALATRVRAAVGASPAAALLPGSAAIKLAATVGAAAGGDLSSQGLELVALAVTAIGDPGGYLADLARPVRARAARDARIAAARSDAEAVAAEQRHQRVATVPSPTVTAGGPGVTDGSPGVTGGIAGTQRAMS